MRTLRTTVRVSAAIFALLGIVVGVFGTLQMTRMYHPYTSLQVFRNILGVISRWVISGRAEAEALLKTSADLGEINKEDRTRSLFGLYLLILSFVFQSVGAGLAVVDTFLPPDH